VQFPQDKSVIEEFMQWNHEM